MAADVQEHFATLARTGAWDDLYEGPETAANVSFRVRLALALELLPAEAREVLDVGCGPIPLAPPILSRGARYTGLDQSLDMLLRARGRDARAHLVRGAFPLPFAPESFDAVVALGLLEYLPDPLPMLGEMRRVTRSGGIVIVSIPKRFHVDRLTTATLLPARKLAAMLWGSRSDSLRRCLLSPSELDLLASRVGLAPDGGYHYHFTPFPYPFTVLAPRWAHRINRPFERPAPGTLLRFFAHGYIGRYRRA